MAGRFSEKCRVTIADDNMSATLFIEPPEDGIAYSVEELTGFLKNKGVYGGIVFSALEEMSQNNIYYKDYPVAKGSLPEEGSNGYYELFFEHNVKKKPVIRSDGSVDYQSMSEIQCVSVGEKLAVYHPAIPGKNGVDVRGRDLRTRAAVDLPKLKGTGFNFDSDSYEYTAATDGKIEFDGKILKISNVYEYRGDLDLVVGKIDFRGDVIVKGSVLAGTLIRATKSITVEGNVEAATLISGGDIILKKGMQGGQKARISCGGDLYANFVEFTTIETKGKVEANIIMNCQIEAGTDIIVSGKKGAIVGGETYSVGEINTTLLGNVAALRTAAHVGMKKELIDRKKLLSTKATTLKNSIENTKKELFKLKDARLATDPMAVREAKVSQLNRRLNKDEKMVSHILTELEKIEKIEGIAKRAKISVAGITYPGVQIQIDNLSLDIDTERKAAKYIKEEYGDCIKVDTV